jgi:hypothetical protein
MTLELHLHSCIFNSYIFLYMKLEYELYLNSNTAAE